MEAAWKVGRLVAMRFMLTVLAVFLVTALWAQVPGNDRFNQRILLTGTSTSSTASNTNATKELREPNHAGSPGGRSLWWAWTAPTNGDLTIRTDDSDFDTVLGVYTGVSVSTLSLVATNDDHGYGFTSRVRFQAAMGQQYQIAVDGYNDGTNISSGNVVFSLTFLPEPIARPTNDNFRDKTALGRSPVVVAGSNLHATREPGESVHAGRLGDASVWWSWTAPASEKIRITTEGSSFDTVLAVYIYTGLSVSTSNLTEVAANDDADAEHGVLSSTVEFDAVAGVSYAIAVDGFDGAMGDVVLSLAPEAPRLENPVFENNVFGVSLSTVVGRTYYLEYRNSLADSNWTRFPGVAGNGARMALTDATASGPARFYRVAME